MAHDTQTETPRTPLDRAVDELRRVVDSSVLTADDDGFDEAVRGFNPAVQHRPDLVVVAGDAGDVSAAMTVAREHALGVQVQASGHGPSVRRQGGLLLRTSGLDAIDIDPSERTARVGAGVLWSDLVAACAEYGLAPFGMASVGSVGVAGYLLGGGMGPLGRRDGFGADHVVAAELVGADGRERIVDAGHEPDLFWAVRGGRLLPGVITAFTVALQPAPELFVATVTFERAVTAAALAAYADWQATLAEVSGSTATLFRFPDLPALPEQLRGRRRLQVDVVHVGAETAGRSALDRLLAAQQPDSVTTRVTDPAGWMAAIPPVPSGPSWQRGMLLRRLDADIAEAIVRSAGPETEVPWQVVEIRPFGGALGRPPVAANAVGGRTDGVLLSAVASTPHGDDGLGAAFAELGSAVARWVQPGLNVNFRGPEDLDHPLRESWPAPINERLARIRTEYDPEEMFARPAQ